MSDDTVLKVGDTVSLNSGGHVMTVASVDGDSVTCDWSVKGDVKSKSFAAAELKKAEAPLTTLEQIAARPTTPKITAAPTPPSPL
jgi:uncharacterized protein YodC (DUF2158 family)